MKKILSLSVFTLLCIWLLSSISPPHIARILIVGTVLEFRLKISDWKVILRELWIKNWHSRAGQKSLKRKSGQLCWTGHKFLISNSQFAINAPRSMNAFGWILILRIYIIFIIEIKGVYSLNESIGNFVRNCAQENCELRIVRSQF